MGLTGNTTYSFKDTTGAIVSALAGPFIIAGGNIGSGQFVIENTTTRSENDTCADGSVMTSYISGSSGSFAVEVQQTSPLHKYLLAAFNLHTTAADADDVSLWTGITIQLRNILDGSQHLLTGVSFTKAPTKTYSARGQMLTWTLLGANVINM